jgi:hypothetical protein
MLVPFSVPRFPRCCAHISPFICTVKVQIQCTNKGEYDQKKIWLVAILPRNEEIERFSKIVVEELVVRSIVAFFSGMFSSWEISKMLRRHCCPWRTACHLANIIMISGRRHDEIRKVHIIELEMSSSV